MFSAVLDTSVLWPNLQRDFLLSLAIEGLYRPLWSSAILAELEYHEAQKNFNRGDSRDAAEAKARHLIEQMTDAFDDAAIENWEPHEGTFDLPDPDDEHVVAAAVVSGAGAIVTANLRDFPAARIPPNIKVLAPATFAADTVAVAPALARRALREMSSRFGDPPRTVDEIIALLVNRYGMTEAAELINE